MQFVPDTSPTSDMIHGDDTMDCVWNGFPVMLVGFSDMNRVFHPIMLCMCTRKTTADYTFIYQTYKTHRPHQMIKYSMSDGALAIGNGVIAVYRANGNEVTRLMCWVHVIIKNFVIQLKRVGTADLGGDVGAIKLRLHIKNYMFSEMKCLHQCSTLRMFNYGCELWRKKYVDDLKDSQPGISQVST